MTTPTQEFNLLDEPWIRARTHQGDVVELSLLETFERGGDLRRLAGEIPTQDAAILRLLLAILLRATRPDRPRTMEGIASWWKALWDERRLPLERVRDYLTTYRDRFDLLDPVQPFFQVAGLSTRSGKTSGLGKLIAEVPDGHPFFTTRAGVELTSLSFAEAARWVVHCQAFDPSGIKTGASDDPRVTGGKGYPIGPAWAGRLGIVVAEGSSLTETLLLNLPAGVHTEQDDAPVWERPPLTGAPDRLHPEPTGVADLFTWPARRIRLFHDGVRVRDVQISNGDKLDPQNRHGIEPMSAWRHSAPQSKKFGQDVYMPQEHDPSRRIWQGLGAILVDAPGPKGHLRPGTLDWIAGLIEDAALPPEFPVAFRTIGVKYGTQNAFIEDIVDDSLDCRVAALTEPPLVRLVTDAAAAASQGAVALANLASNLAQAAGGDPEPPRAAAFELGYSRLDGPYRRWLSSLTSGVELVTARIHWHDAARAVLIECGTELVAGAGDVAWVGREITRANTTVYLDTAQADLWFRSALLKALPRPTPVPETAHA